MPSKMYVKAKETPKRRYDDLPVDRPVAIYYRQSTTAQLGNEETRKQKEALPKTLAKMGWSPADIWVIDEDAAKSGTLDIIDRSGMTKLMDMIRKEEIGAVAIVSENRAFRDQYLTEASAFVRSCAQHKIPVLVPGKMTYIFHDPGLGSTHQDMFLDECKEGWKFIQYHIKGKMLVDRLDIALEGKWVGHAVATGYMVDLTNPRRKSFVPYEPAATVIRAWFALFLHYKGNRMATWKHIRDHGPYLPDVTDPAVQAKLPKNDDGTPRFRLRNPNKTPLRNGHLYLSRSALDRLFSNVFYIGWATVTTESESYIGPRGGKGRHPVNTKIVRDNHPGIVDPDIFWEAFNYLSETTIDGDPNPDYKKRQVTRPKNTGDPRRASVPQPFLVGKLSSPDTRGDMHRVVPIWNGKTNQYEYSGWSYGASWGEGDIKLWTKSTDQVDRVVHEMLAPLALYEQHDEIAQMLSSQNESLGMNFDNERARCQDMIRLAKKEVAQKHMLWSNTQEKELVSEAVDAWKKARDNVTRWEAELARINALEADQHSMTRLRTAMFTLLADYWSLSLEDKRLVLQLCVERIEARKIGSDLEITTVYWGGAKRSRVIGLRGDNAWTQAECQRLLTLAEQAAPALQIAASFPDRKWGAILSKYQRLTGRCISSCGPIRKAESYFAFVHRQPIDAYAALTADLPWDLSAVIDELRLLRKYDLDGFLQRLDQRIAEGWITRQNGVGTSDNWCSPCFPSADSKLNLAAILLHVEQTPSLKHALKAVA